MRIGRRLVDHAVWWDDRCTWLGDAIEPTAGGWEVTHRSLGGDLYDGTSGVAWFLAHLWRVGGATEIRSTAEGALRHAISAASTDRRSNRGLYVGPLGVALAAVEAGPLLDAGHLTIAGYELGGAIADDVAAGAGTTDQLDVLGGAAGTLLGLLGLAARRRELALLEAARSLGDQLIALARPGGAGWYWPLLESEPGAGKGLCGLAHGAAGVAWALSELHAATGAPRYREAAMLACRYERSWYATGRGWPDLRPPEHTETDDAAWPTYPAYWCHGAVGIGLQRLRFHELTGDRVALAEAGAALASARTAARAALNHPPGSFSANFSLCHGLGGIADLQAEAAVVLGESAQLRSARALGEAGLRRVAADGHWPCGVPGGGETPALMLGLAGIGACYLRLHDPTALPSPGLLVRWPGPATAIIGSAPLARGPRDNA